MYFEIFKGGNLIKRGTSTLNELSWSNELMTVPSLQMDLPIEYLDYLSGREEVKVFVNGKCFWGIVTSLSADKAREILHVDLEHVIHEWTYRQISVNNAVKDKRINVVFKGAETATNGSTSITANPFDILLEEVGRLSTKQYVKRAGAYAWTADGTEVTSISVNKSAIKHKEGSYDVVFTAKGASVTVEATVKVITHEKSNRQYKIKASDFMMLTSEVGTFTAADYIDRADASAQTTGGTAVTPTVDASNVRAESGSYTVYFSVGNLKLSVKATVKVSYDESSTSDATIADDLNDIYADTNFAYPGWRMNLSSKAKKATIDYVYSRQTKLEALTKTMELTDDLFWRVRFVNEKVVDISEMGEKKNYIFSTKPSGPNNIRIITEPTVEPDFENVINLATVYSEKSDSGMSSMTLREVYNDPSLQLDGFPCLILRANVNNERDYTMYTTQYPKLAPNNELEYAVIDEESVALEGGTVIEGTYAFNDLSPFNIDSSSKKTQLVTDKDRIKASQTAYLATVRKLKEARRGLKIKLVTEEIPADLNVGDKVRLLYDNSIYVMEACSSYMKKILSYDDWFYITEIQYRIGKNEEELNEVTLEKFIRIDRETRNES